MKTVQLGRTGLAVTKTALGCLPLQRTQTDEAVRILRRAYDAGITFYDTAHSYTDSEEKIGKAFSDRRRQDVVIATKTPAVTKSDALKHIEQSLRMLQTDYIDIIQLHNPAKLPNPEDPESSYAGLVEAKKKGYVRHIGLSNHRLPLALEAIESGLYETLQFPFSYLAAERDIELVRRCRELDVGFIAMKGLSGGMLTNAKACFAFMTRFENVVPIWGMQHMWELEQWLELDSTGAAMDDEMLRVIEADKKELAGDFCRACGYCLPCPAEIQIPTAARMKMLLRRSPYQRYITDEWYDEMHKIDNCINCRSCAGKCPYSLDTPRLLREMLTDYDAFFAEHRTDRQR